MTNELTINGRLSDTELLNEVKRLTAQEQQATARLITALGELDARRLYLGEGCSSLFSYCTQVLHLSEHAAYLRIEAARAARKFPAIRDLLADGALHLTAISLLSAHLTQDNHQSVLASARHKSKRAVEETSRRQGRWRSPRRLGGRRGRRDGILDGRAGGDAARLGVYGYSRGGGVALIAGQRDRRIKAVLAFAPPTDFFTAMGRPSVDWASRLEEAARDAGLQPDTRESQFLDWFVRGRETLPLTELRRRIAAASPLYFATRLPPFQIHQGDADRAVPVRNATALRDRVSASDARSVFIYAGAGHLLDDTAAAATARAFLVRHLN